MKIIFWFVTYLNILKIVLINLEQNIATQSYYSINLYGAINKQGYYYLHVNVGTPPQKQSLIIDTGSSHISFSCSTCLNCGAHEYPSYNLSKSVSGVRCENTSVYNINKCIYFHNFGEGSTISGKYFSDILIFGEREQLLRKRNQNILKFRYEYIGCNEFETQNFLIQNASGILGLGLAKNIDNSMNMVFSLLNSTRELLNMKNTNNIVISLCLLSIGGKINIGEYSNQIIENNDKTYFKNHFELITWVPLVYPSRIYKFKLKEVAINSKVIYKSQDESINAIVDVGSTFTYIPDIIYNYFKSEFSKICNLTNRIESKKCKIVPNSFCWNNIFDIYHLFPTIQLEFYGQSKVIEWTHISYLYNKEGKWWCLGIKRQDISRNKDIVLGISFLKNRQIILDPHKSRIGINVELIKSCKKINYF